MSLPIPTSHFGKQALTGISFGAYYPACKVMLDVEYLFLVKEKMLLNGTS